MFGSMGSSPALVDDHEMVLQNSPGLQPWVTRSATSALKVAAEARSVECSLVDSARRAQNSDATVPPKAFGVQGTSP
jgi:hypothetical protein